MGVVAATPASGDNTASRGIYQKLAGPLVEVWDFMGLGTPEGARESTTVACATGIIAGVPATWRVWTWA